jgi:two-component system phosphate regulon sensor histidine kinase PhoR
MRNRENILAFGVALLGALAWLVLWAYGWIAEQLEFSPRDFALAVGFCAVVASLLWAARRSESLHQQAHRYLTVLGHIDHMDLAGENGVVGLPSLAKTGLWRGVLSQLVEQLRESGEQLCGAEQRRASLELKARRSDAQHERMMHILSGLPDAVLVVDEYGELVLANQCAEQLLDLKSQKGDTSSLDQNEKCTKLVDLLGEIRRHKTLTQRTDELEIVNAAGQACCYRVTARAIRHDNRPQEGAAHGAVAVLRDISGQKAIQRRNAEFVSAVSHEMKTPLSGIKAYVELLVDGDAEDEETREEFLGVINSQADRLQRLIDNMLNIATIEAGVVTVSKDNRSLNEILEEALGVVGPSAEAKRITVTSYLSPMYLGVHVDRDMFLQSVINLLSNAIKYTAEDGAVTLRSRMQDGEVQVEVQDTGVGLSEEDCENVFKKFYRVKKDQTMAAGTGLGLPLAKHIVEDVHNGRLEVSSAVGVGSTFTITIPSAGKISTRTPAGAGG